MTRASKIKILIVDDSKVSRDLLIHIIQQDPDLEVIGQAENAQQTLYALEVLKPDVITIDIEMPGMDGFELTKHIMHTRPTPIVIISSHYTDSDMFKGFKALEAGALAILPKPKGPTDPNFKTQLKKINDSIKMIADIKLITKKQVLPQTIVARAEENLRSIKMVCIGSSLGGPQALEKIFSKLTAKFPLPILVVQHISAGFTEGLADWLSKVTPLQVKIAENNETPKPGVIYLAPDNYHMEINSIHNIRLTDEPPLHNTKPSVGKLFLSAAKYCGPKALGIILTGMGNDGAEELLVMKEKGALTIAQDEESCLIFGMPKEAIARGAAKKVLSLTEITHFLLQLAEVHRE